VKLAPLERLPTTWERAADVIRTGIFAGDFPPGVTLPEVEIARRLQVSRNTARDALRVLVNERLLTYRAHRGVAVRTLGPSDVRDIYLMRRWFELAALDRLDRSPVDALAPIVSAAERAMVDERWGDVGTENLNFHTALVASMGSPRADRAFRQLMTELRLGFLAVRDQVTFHGPYVGRNRRILDLIADGDLDSARDELSTYLDESERHVLEAVEGG